MKIDLVYDIETYDEAFYLRGQKTFNAKYLCGGTWSARDGYIFWGINEEDALADYILEHGGNAFAHSGGTFDHLWLIDNAVRRRKIVVETDLFSSGSRLVTATVFNTALYDSWAIAPMKLEKLTAGLGISKMKLELPCVCGESCNGFCSFSPSMTLAHYRRMIQYLEADVISLRDALRRLFEFAKEHGIQIKATIGATAWNHARKLCNLDVAVWDRADYKYIRAAYNGGYTKAVRHVRGATGRMVDVNSSYPTTMSDFAFPIGDFERAEGALASKRFASGTTGIITAVVTVPEIFMPTLAVREPNKGPIYPTGRFRGTWTTLSLQRAVERGEARIERVCHGLFWRETAQLYGPFVKTFYDIRAAELIRSPDGKDSALGTWAKLVANSLSGKLGVKPSKRRYTINGLVRVCHCGEPECTCGSTVPVSDHVVEGRLYRIDPCAHIHHAAFITSHASQRLFDAAYAVGHDHVYYFDTDSVFGSRDGAFDRLSLGDRLGQWSSKEIANLFVYGAKLYEYDDPHNPDPKKQHIVKAKGASSPTTAAPGTSTIIRTVSGLKKTLEGGFRADVFARHLSETWSDRVPDATPRDPFATRPKRIDEL